MLPAAILQPNPPRVNGPVKTPDYFPTELPPKRLVSRDPAQPPAESSRKAPATPVVMRTRAGGRVARRSGPSRWTLKKRPATSPRLEPRAFVRQMLDQVGVGAEVERFSYGGQTYVLPTTALVKDTG